MSPDPDARPAQDATVTVRLNGHPVVQRVPARMLLVHFLRDVAQATGTHVGCDTGNCGACTILLDGEPVKSCMTLAVQADGCAATTIEGLSSDEANELRQRFTTHGAIQCGYCTPGMLINATALLARTPDADEATIRRWLKGNLCMCTGYQQIVDSIKSAGQVLSRTVDERSEDGDE